MKRYIYSKSPYLITHFLLLVLFVVLPFIFFDRLFETETTFRFIIAGALVCFFSLFFLVLYISADGFTPPMAKSNRFYQIIAVYIVFTGLTIFLSLNKGDALYIYLKLCTVAGCFFLFIILFRNVPDLLSLLIKYSNVSIFIFTLIALSQIGLQLKAESHIRISYKLSSSLGNKNFYAETMALFLPLILMGTVILRGRWRYISVINTILILVTIILLQTLSTWLAVAIFILFLCGMLMYTGSRNLLPSLRLNSGKGYALMIGLVVIIGFAISISYHMNQFKPIQKRVDKITEYSQSNESYKNEDHTHTNSIAERIFLWKNAWRMFEDHPITGVGMANWKIYATKYELPFSRYSSNNLTRYTHPHNDLLLILAEGGIIAFALFVSLFIYAFILFFRLLRSPIPPDRKMVILLAASGLIIYLIIACISLPGDRFYTQILLFLFFAIICSAYDAELGGDSPIGRVWIAVICLVSAISGLSTAFVGAQRYSSEVHLIYALKAQSQKDWQKMGYHSAMAKNFFYPLDHTATPIAWYQGMASFYAGSPATARFYYEEAYRVNPYDLNVLNDLATSVQREGDNVKAMKIYDQALAMAPYFWEAFRNKTILIYNQIDREKAYQYMHTYPQYSPNDEYYRILTVMLSNKVIDAVGDSVISSRYLKKKKGLLRMDSVAIADHVPFEQLVLRDTVLTDLK